MRGSRARWALALSSSVFALGSVGCSVTIDQIFEMQEGSGVDVSLLCQDGTCEVPQGRLVFEGGAVMRIDVSTTLVEYLDGTVDGDVEILDLLFAVPGFQFLIVNTGLVCVVLDDPPGGGTFSYDVLAEEATFDVLVNTKALITNAFLANLVRGGAFAFPFDLQASMPLTLVDAVGLVSGTGTMVVTQELDAYYTVPLINVPNDPSQDTLLPIHVKGTVTLESTDTFPATELVLDCIDLLGT